MNANVTVIVFTAFKWPKSEKKTMPTAVRVTHSHITATHIKPSSSSAFIAGLTKTPAVVSGNYEVQLRSTLAPFR